MPIYSVFWTTIATFKFDEMNTTSVNNPSDEDYQTAGEWLELLSEQPLDELSKRRLLHWLDSHPERRALLERMVTTWADPALSAAAQNLVAAQSNRQQAPVTHFRRGAAWAVCFSLCLALLVSNRFLSDAPEISRSLPFATATGIRHDLQLEEGSLLEISPASRLAITLNATRRHVELQQGAAYFRIAKDKTRPFSVSIGSASVVAVGTEFNIDRLAEATEVTVYEGAIDLRAEPQDAPLRLVAGDQARVSATGIKLKKVELTGLVDWRSGWLELQDGNLGFLVEQLNRYSSSQIQLADPDLAQLPLAGRFQLKNVAASLALLTELHPLEQRHINQQGAAVIQLMARN